MPMNDEVDLPSMVHELFVPDRKVWNHSLLVSLFDIDTVSEIEKIHIPLEDKSDFLCWLPAQDG